MAETYPATPELIERITRLIDAHHPHLQNARFKVEWRATTPVIQFMPTSAEVDTPNNDAQAREYDFYLWFAADAWAEMTDFQRDALTEHELYHCGWDEAGKPLLLGHHLEEFDGVLARYGLWRSNSETTYAAIAAMVARWGQGGNTMPSFGEYQYAMQGNHGSSGAGNHGSSGAGNHGSSGAGNHGSSGAGGYDEPLSPEDALIQRMMIIRNKFRAAGFSEIETGRLTESFLRNYIGVISEGNHGSSGA